MGKIKRYKNVVELFLSGEKGQRFFNAAYSLGAAVVIWGALFKILHLPGGNTLLCVGMGTEVLMFILTAFDRPEQQYKWEDVFPVLAGDDSDEASNAVDITGAAGVAAGYVGAPQGGSAVGATVYAQGNAGGAPVAAADTSTLAAATESYMGKLTEVSEQISRLSETTEALNEVSQRLLQNFQVISSSTEALSDASVKYAERVDTLSKNMDELGTTYQSQLQGVTMQVDSMNRIIQGFQAISMEPERMANNMRQLNMAYERMLGAMVNPYGSVYNPYQAAPPMQTPQQAPFAQPSNTAK